MKIVPDSNLIVAQVIPLPYSEKATQKLQQWQDQQAELLVPTLCFYEIVSTVRKVAVTMELSTEQVTGALEDILALGIQEIQPTPILHQQALVWAAKLQQTVAYDAAFLAAAESVEAELWTADRKFAKAARNLGLDWVHHLHDA